MDNVPLLSTGKHSTLGNWLKLCRAAFGDASPAVAFLQRKIAESPGGENEPVLANEGQFLRVLGQMDTCQC